MARWECRVHRLICDEMKGRPEDGVAAGSRWKRTRRDLYCFDCSVANLYVGDGEDTSIAEQICGAIA